MTSYSNVLGPQSRSRSLDHIYVQVVILHSPVDVLNTAMSVRGSAASSQNYIFIVSTILSPYTPHNTMLLVLLLA